MNSDDPLAGLLKRFERPQTDDDPVVWALDKMKTHTWSKQREILRLLEVVPRVAVPSCHSAGKSKTAALAAARFLAKYPPGTARIVTTAPTMTQVRAVLWNEINQLHAQALDDEGMQILPGRVNQTEWWIGGYMAGIGRKPADYDPAAFSGLHAEHMLVIIDEAGGVPNDVWVSVDTLATNEGSKILAIGNPDDPQANFRTICEDAPENGWTVVKIPAWETPNLSGEPAAPIFKRVLITPDWVDRHRVLWGEDSPLWQAKIAAEFPDENNMGVFRVADVTYAMNYDEPAPKNSFDDVQLGVDIAASETGDQTVIRERRGHKIGRRWAVRSGEPEDISDLIVHAAIESGATLLHVDATGVGFGFLADLRRQLPNVVVKPFIAAARAVDNKQYENRRAEAHWIVREKMRHHELDFSDMEHQEETVAQMMAIRYRLKKGRILVEPKEDIRKRLPEGRSPDDSDALLLAIISPEGSGAPAAATISSGRNRKAGLIPKRSPFAPQTRTRPRTLKTVV
jgi:hypothetical protein